jgi:hypothetical protein
MIIRLLGILWLCFQFSLAQAQISVKEIQFENKEFNFGKLEYGHATIKAVFNFKNTSQTAFRISDVSAECGCTVPNWPKTDIKPGESATITANFDPSQFMGDVEKKIDVMGNFKDEISITLFIRGVINEPVFMDAEFQPGQFGYLRLSSNILGMGSFGDKGTQEAELKVYNDYNRPLSLTKVTKKPAYVDFNLPVDPILPGDTAVIKLLVHSDQVQNLGLVNDIIMFETSDIYYKTKSFEIAFELYHDMSSYTKKKMKKAPKIQLSERNFDLGRIKQGAKVSKEVIISNQGKMPLKILKVDSDCSCAFLNIEDVEIAPGASLTTQLTFDALFKDGLQNKTIFVYTNDPLQAKIKLNVKAFVTE